MDTAAIRVTEDPISVYEDVLRALESHRPSKAEQDILAQIGREFQLPRNPRKWPQALASTTSVETFLDFTLRLIAPFVDMVLDIYSFLAQYVSTTGGRTTHFEINSEALSQPLRFEHLNFPKRVRWISAWAQVNIEDVVIDWAALGQTLRIDNGIFYGEIDKVRLLQSLIIARREGRLSPELRQIGDHINSVVRRAVTAWYRRASLEQEDGGDARKWKFVTFVPHLHEFLRQGEAINPNTIERGRVAIDLDMVTMRGAPRSLEQTFGGLDPRRDKTLEALGTDQTRDWNIAAAIFFCAFWGLEESSFRRAASLLTAHEDRDDLLRGAELERRGAALGRRLVERLESLIVPTGESESREVLTQQKLELLLLPFWKDRWFLFEVWTLLQPLMHALSLGARVDLVGVARISNAGVQGETWDLPTQKAKNEVARLESERGTLLVWFQRETRRYDKGKNMEPDVRITLPWSPFPDIAIIECKDRVRFGGKRVEDLAYGYLTGSAARVVWIVNYEEGRKGWDEFLEPADDDRSLGFAFKFRPKEIGSAFQSSLDELLTEHLHLHETKSEEEYLVIDVSGSMDGKRLPNLDTYKSLATASPSRLKLWSNDVHDAGPDQRRALFDRSLIEGVGMGQGAESSTALQEFAETLPDDATITLITDHSGRDQALKQATVDGKAHRLAGRKLTITCL